MVRVLTIRELEKLSGVSRSTIHYYLTIGLLPRPQKTASNRSLYTEDHLEILKKIVELKESGLSLEQVEAELTQVVEAANDACVDLAAEEYDRTHQRILASVAKQLIDEGYQSVRVSTIVRSLGITTAVFYAHFPSKRRLLAECVGSLMKWSFDYVYGMQASVDDPAEKILLHCFGYAHVFRVGSTAMALTRVEEMQEDGEPIEAVFNDIVEYIKQNLAERPPRQSTGKEVSDELIARSLFGAYEQTVLRSMADDNFTREDLFLAHIWLFLAVQAARRGEVDIDSRLDKYRELASQLAGMMPPLPPMLDEK